MSKEKKYFCISAGILLLMILGGWLRLTHLSNDTLFMDNEGEFISEARFFAGSELGVPRYAAKPLQSLFLSLGFLFSDQVLTVQRLQALMTLLWIPLVFILARRLMLPLGVAFLASFLTAFDPWIYLYSRHLLAEPLAGLLWMVSLCLLLKPPLRYSKVILSGLFFGLTILATRRMLLFGPGTFLLVLLFQDGPGKERLSKGLVWLGWSALPLILFHFSYEAISGWVPSPYYMSYFKQLAFQLSHHTPQIQWTLKTWATYPLLVHIYEGILLGVFLILGIFSVLKSGLKSTLSKFFCCGYFLPVVYFAFSLLAYARVWAPLLFCHSILGALGIWEVLRLIEKKWRWAMIPATLLFCLSLLGFFLPKILSIQKVTVPYVQAFTQFKKTQNYRLDQIIATSTLVGQWLSTLEGRFIEPGKEFWQKTPRVQEMRLVVFDPYLFAHDEAIPLPFDISPHHALVRRHCEALTKLECGQPKEFWTHFVWEHNVNVEASLKFLKETDLKDLPCVEIYDVVQCLTKK